jgi:hypothetical protein
VTLPEAIGKARCRSRSGLCCSGAGWHRRPYATSGYRHGTVQYHLCSVRADLRSTSVHRGCRVKNTCTESRTALHRWSEVQPEVACCDLRVARCTPRRAYWRSEQRTETTAPGATGSCRHACQRTSPLFAHSVWNTRPTTGAGVKVMVTLSITAVRHCPMLGQVTIALPAATSAALVCDRVQQRARLNVPTPPKIHPRTLPPVAYRRCADLYVRSGVDDRRRCDADGHRWSLPCSYRCQRSSGLPPLRSPLRLVCSWRSVLLFGLNVPVPAHSAPVAAVMARSRTITFAQVLRSAPEGCRRRRGVVPSPPPRIRCCRGRA